MKSLSDLAGESLIIHQPSVWKSYYELKYGEEVLGTIQAKGFFGRNIIFKMGNNQWEIYQPSLWKSEIAIRQSGYELPYATYRREGFKSRGIVRMYKGEQMRVEYKLFTSGYNIQTMSGEKLVTFKDRVSFREKTILYIEKKSELLDKYPWVIVLAWHIMLQRKRAAHAG
jgi:hypothetical protein